MSTVTAPLDRTSRVRPLVQSLPVRLALAVALALHALPHLMGVALTLNPPTAGTCAADATVLGCTAWLPLPGWMAPVQIVGWSAGTIAFLVVAWAVLAGKTWAARALVITTVGSLALCALSLPGGKIGLVIDLAILLWVAGLGWFRRRAAR